MFRPAGPPPSPSSPITPARRPEPPVPEPTLLSVVVPVHGVRRYLTECLDSLLGAPGGAPGDARPAQPVGIEVIAVDDASPDECGQLLDERSGLDRRLTVVHLDRPGGPGNARNAGLARATGRYVWFVDGDDLVSPGALASVTGRLASEHPDLLLIDYEELYPDGGTRPSQGRGLLRAAPLAGRLSALDEVCYSYRRSRPGSFMATTSSAHENVFDAYRDVLGMLAKLVEAGDPVATPAVQSAMFERAISHYAAVLETAGPGVARADRPGLVPRDERRRFFDRMHADYQRYRPSGYRRPAGLRGVKFRLIERDAYWAYELLEPVNKARVAMRRAAGASRPAHGRGGFGD